MKTKKIVFIVLLAFIIVYMLLKWSGVLMAFQVPSTSNEPNLKVGSRFLGSSLKKPRPLDFAYFKFSDSLEGWTIVKRLIAVPGDTLKCVNGNYFVNGVNIDKDINLRFAYKISPKVFNAYIRGKIEDEDFYKYYYSDSIIAFLDDSFVDDLPIQLDRNYDKERSMLSNEIFNENSDWTTNNFGPIILPEEKYFFSGDSRDNSIDSRYRGFVDENNIIGTVLINF
ncbi:S26 family signal peptidase [Winogradskyella sp. SYSU M77433]|uniref:S26 family signal peptidase n=1 Tax=Winogradskyella sp. SYSU M77433 TaxID=3042722 RepID=UPI00247FEA65|nr:S26 family signal peptidase [Winogradskyella sp. SYSU M77433]MDH7911235.1 S26 family signal peptidase [Winogradskyella sp. SYSU M77433]